MKKNPLSLYRSLSPAVKTALWFTLCNILQRGTSLITTPIFTRLLTTDEYGLCNIYFGWFEVFAIFASLKLPYEGLNNGLIRHEEDKDRYTSSIMGLILTLTAVTAAVYLLLHPWIDRFTRMSGFLMAFMFVQHFCNPGLFLWTNRERFDFRYRWPVIVTIASTILAPTVAVLAVLNTSYRAEARILGTAGVQCFFGVICIGILFARGRTFYHREYWRFAVTFNLPLIFYYLSQIILNQSDRLMINYYIGPSEAGIYSVAYTAATLMHLIVTAVNGSLNPWVYQKLKAGREQEVGKAVFSLLLLMAAGTAAMSALAPDLVSLLATADYREAIWIIPPVAASEFFIFFYMLLANVEMYYGENRPISIISILAAVSNLILNAIFIPLYGYLAAGWTTLVCYVLLTGLHYILMKRARRKHASASNTLLPDRWVLLLAGGVILLTFAMLWTYSLGVLRYGVLAVELAAALVMRRRLLSLLKTIRS